ncbi:MAG TPA: polyphosphate polymerase domain-containing protein [Anaerolineales bacterium]|nr:polyphosphate polymerase domain-containing protein [Anaerolineales bacterium]
MQNLSHIVRKFNRFELKYLVSLQQAEAFKHDLRANLVPDDHGDALGAYAIASLYYDSPDFRFYWEKVDGIKFRRKLRIRRYETQDALTPQTPVFVEIKQRLNRVTQKRRVLLPYDQALALCSQRQLPEPDSTRFSSAELAVLDEVASLTWQYNLRPASLVRYTRQALVGTEYDTGLRVTFDTDLTCHPQAAGPFSLALDDAGDGLALFPSDWCVVEIKVNERIPYWLTELVAAHNLNMVRVSKYCRSIELAQNMPVKSGQLVLA